MTPKLKQTLFILNLSSGRKKASSLLMKLEERGLNYYISESAEAFSSFISSQSFKYKNLIICGGDGTIHSIINQTHHLGLTYAIYPEGSGNGLSRELGYKKDIEHLIHRIERDEKISIDLIKINDRYCVNMSGIGFDGYVAHKFDIGKQRGFKTYVKETLKALFKYQSIDARITYGENELNGQYFMINVANTRQFGNNAYIAPNAQFNDGLIELALIKRLPFYKLPVFLYKMFNLRLTNTKYIKFIQTETLLLETNAVYYHIDGEPLLYKKPLQISIPKQIQFLNPL